MRPLPFVLSCLLLCGCATSGGSGPLMLGPQDHNQVVRVEEGRLIEIRLPAATGAGPDPTRPGVPRWDVDRIDRNALTLVGSPQVEPGAAGSATGTAVVRVKAARPGNGMIRLVYRYPWQQAVNGDTWLVMIQVR